MKETDILDLYISANTQLRLDIGSIGKFESGLEFERAGERCRRVGKELLRLERQRFAILFFERLVKNFISAKKYIKAINLELTIYTVHSLSYNLYEMSGCYEKIASYYTYFLNLDRNAAGYYIRAAKLHEALQNYRAAFKKARFACDCLESSNAKTEKAAAHSLAFRMALQSGYLERAGIHAEKWLSLLKKDYSPHYISVCMKGYKAYSDADMAEKALCFLNEIIIAHFEKNVTQTRILRYLTEAQQLYIKANNFSNAVYDQRILDELGADIGKKIKFASQFKSFCQLSGLQMISDQYYLLENEQKLGLAKNEKRLSHYLGYLLWKYSCNYGTNLYRWFLCSGLIVIIFAVLYAPLGLLFNSSGGGNHFLGAIKPSVSGSHAGSWFTPIYYSVVTFATLGYGDITPADTSGQIFSVLEVLTGYLMLGGLLSVFSKKIVR